MSHEKAQKAQKSFSALDVDIEPGAREAVEYALMEAGALGTETTDHIVTAYFTETPSGERVRSELSEALRIYDLPSSSVRDMNVREVAERDWLEEWKQNWQPVEVGRFIIAPPWTELGETHDRLVIRIEPGMAFGTGTHESTHLCLDANQIDFHVGSVDDSTASADLVCANLTAGVITQMLPKLVGVSCGKLILSGILETQLEMVQAGLHACGVDDFEITQDGEWVALIV